MKYAKKIDTFYQNQGKTVVDILFDNKMFRDSITRDDLKSIEDYIAYCYQNNAESVKMCTEMLIKVNKK